jgi:type I restriction enzyme S subunit
MALQYQTYGLYPVVDQSKKLVSGYTDEASKLFVPPKDGVIVFGDHTREIKFVDFAFVVGADGTQILCVNNSVTKYIYYFLQNLKIPNDGYGRHFKYLKETTYYIPPKKQQLFISNTLSSFDKVIINSERRLRILIDIKHGLLQQMFI